MRVTIVEGTVEEVLQALPNLGENAQPRIALTNGALPQDVQQVLGLARPADRDAVDRYVAEVLSWDGVGVAAGHRRTGGLTAYVRFFRRAGTQGAFAYLFPGRTYTRARLPAEELARARFSTVRGGRAATGEWSRNLALAPEEAWEEALEFTRRAYDRSAA